MSRRGRRVSPPTPSPPSQPRIGRTNSCGQTRVRPVGLLQYPQLASPSAGTVRRIVQASSSSDPSWRTLSRCQCWWARRSSSHNRNLPSKTCSLTTTLPGSLRPHQSSPYLDVSLGLGIEASLPVYMESLEDTTREELRRNVFRFSEDEDEQEETRQTRARSVSQQKTKTRSPVRAPSPTGPHESSQQSSSRQSSKKPTKVQTQVPKSRSRQCRRTSRSKSWSMKARPWETEGRSWSSPSPVRRRLVLPSTPPATETRVVRYANNQDQASMGGGGETISTRLDHLDSSLRKVRWRSPSPPSQQHSQVLQSGEHGDTRNTVHTEVLRLSDDEEEFEFGLDNTATVDSGSPQRMPGEGGPRLQHQGSLLPQPGHPGHTGDHTHGKATGGGRDALHGGGAQDCRPHYYPHS